MVEKDVLVDVVHYCKIYIEISFKEIWEKIKVFEDMGIRIVKIVDENIAISKEHLEVVINSNDRKSNTGGKVRLK